MVGGVGHTCGCHQKDHMEGIERSHGTCSIHYGIPAASKRLPMDNPALLIGHRWTPIGSARYVNTFHFRLPVQRAQKPFDMESFVRDGNSRWNSHGQVSTIKFPLLVMSSLPGPTVYILYIYIVFFLDTPSPSLTILHHLHLFSGLCILDIPWPCLQPCYR